MSIIDADGLINGDRLRACSDQARLWWPYLFLQANSFGRIELDYHQLIVRCAFRQPPAEAEFYTMMQEYRDNHLCFLYEAPNGTAWGQWWAKAGSLPRYQSARDKRSPSPPEKEYERWQKSYVKKTKASRAFFGKVAESSQKVAEKFHLGEERSGVGVGVGEGVGVGGESIQNPVEPPVEQPAPLEKTSAKRPAKPPHPSSPTDLQGVGSLMQSTPDLPLPSGAMPASPLSPVQVVREMLIDWLYPCRFTRPPDERLCEQLLRMAGSTDHLATWLRSMGPSKDKRAIQSWGWFVTVAKAELQPAMEGSHAAD